MKVIKILIVLFLIGFIVSCSTTIDVTYNYDPQADFSELKTFDWMPATNKAGIDRFIVQHVNAELKAKGLTITSNNPDFLIAEFHAKKDKAHVVVTERGYNWGDREYRGIDRKLKYQYEEGSLILDFVDTKSKILIWRGVGKAEIQNVDTPEEKGKLINAAVKKILKKYPPSSSK
jgi:hypothetical protein